MLTDYSASTRIWPVLPRRLDNLSVPGRRWAPLVTPVQPTGKGICISDYAMRMLGLTLSRTFGLASLSSRETIWYFYRRPEWPELSTGIVTFGLGPISVPSRNSALRQSWVRQLKQRVFDPLCSSTKVP